MNHTFDTVDEKVAEAEFFLRKMAEARELFVFNCYLSAFLSASRTCTLALQQFNSLPNFQEWYEFHREWLKSSETARFFLDTRNRHVHGGPYPIAGASFYKGTAEFHFSPTSQHAPSEDVVTV